MAGFRIRPIQPEDDPGVARIIGEVMREFGANGPGFALHDPEVSTMHAAYDRATGHQCCNRWFLKEPLP